MRFAPLFLTASAALLISVALSGCGPIHSDVDYPQPSNITSIMPEYGIVIDDESGKIVGTIASTFDEPESLAAYKERPGETLFIFEGRNSLKSAPFNLDGEITIEGTPYDKAVVASFSLTSEEIVEYYNQIVDQGFTHDFKDREDSPADLVFYDINDRLEMAGIDGILPIVPLALNGRSESNAYDPIAASYIAHLTGDEAAQVQYEVNCEQQQDQMGYDQNETLFYESCADQFGAQTSPGDGTIVSTITEYDFNCATVGLTVSNWGDFSSNLNTALKTTNVHFSLENIGTLDITTSLPCALKTYTHVEQSPDNDNSQTGYVTEGELVCTEDKCLSPTD